MKSTLSKILLFLALASIFILPDLRSAFGQSRPLVMGSTNVGQASSFRNSTVWIRTNDGQVTVPAGITQTVGSTNNFYHTIFNTGVTFVLPNGVSLIGTNFVMTGGGTAAYTNGVWYFTAPAAAAASIDSWSTQSIMTAGFQATSYATMTTNLVLETNGFLTVDGYSVLRLDGAGTPNDYSLRILGITTNVPAVTNILAETSHNRTAVNNGNFLVETHSPSWAVTAPMTLQLQGRADALTGDALTGDFFVGSCATNQSASTYVTYTGTVLRVRWNRYSKNL